MLLGQRGQVPPPGHRLGGRGEAEVAAAEQLHVRRQAQPVQGVPGLLVQVGGGDPHPRRHRAEAEPGEPRAQQVPLAPFLLRYREHRQQPFPRRVRVTVPVDPPVAVVQQLPRLRRERVPRRAVRGARGQQEAAPLQPGHRRTDRRGVHAGRAQQADQRRHRDRALEGPPVGSVERDDQGSRSVLLDHGFTVGGGRAVSPGSWRRAAGTAAVFPSRSAEARGGRRRSAGTCAGPVPPA